MQKNVNPLTFLSVDGKLEGRFPLLCPAVTKTEDLSWREEGILVWPVDGSAESDKKVVSLIAGIRVS